MRFSPVALVLSAIFLVTSGLAVGCVGDDNTLPSPPSDGGSDSGDGAKSEGGDAAADGSKSAEDTGAGGDAGSADAPPGDALPGDAADGE